MDFRSTPDGVLVLGNARARGRESGIRLSAPAAWLAEVRAGRVYRFRSFTSHEEALEAVGLRE